MPVVLLLNPYVDAILCLALAFLIVGIMESLAPFLQKVPWVGGQLANAARSMAQAISHACGVAVQGITHLIGTAFHATARLVDHTYHQFRSHAVAIYQAADLLNHIASAIHRLKATVAHAVGSVGAVLPRVKTLEKEWHGIEHRVKTLERKISQGIGHDLRIRIKALEKEYTGLRDTVIPNVRGIAQHAEHEVTDLRQWVEDHALLVGTTALTGAVAWALSSLGLGWLRCNSNPFNNNKNACGLWGDLSSLLGLATLAIAAADFEELVKEAQSLEEEAVGAIKTLWNL